MRIVFKLSAAAMILSMTGFATSASAQVNGLLTSSRVALSSCDSCGDAGCDSCESSYDAGCDSCGSAVGCGCSTSLGCCDLGEEYKLFGTSRRGIDVGGWTQLGYHSLNNGLFNDHKDRLNLQQQWLYAEKVADGSCGWDWGFRADVLYGVDAQNTQAFGNSGNPASGWDNGWDNGIYGFALPQSYVEVARGDLSIKAGRFFTLLGYEVVPATGNFFYSKAYTMNNSEAFTHTGALATYQVNDSVTTYGGWTQGWDTAFDSNSQGNSFLGGLSVDLYDDLTITYILTAGNLGVIGTGYSHSIVADAHITDRLNYIVQSDYLDTDLNSGNESYGLNQYLIYSISDCVGVGTRIEWWKNNGVSTQAWTAGINYRPHANVIFRPEVRYDWGTGAAADVNDKVTFAVDAILTF